MSNEAIDKLRYQGYGYRKISIMLGLPEGRVKSYCYRHPLEFNQKVCLECGKVIYGTPHKREKNSVLISAGFYGGILIKTL